MARIIAFSSRGKAKENRGNLFGNVWDWFGSLDRFTKMIVIIGILLGLTTPAIVGESTGFFSHAANTVFSNCIVPPPNLSQQDLQLLSQTRKVNWCNPLAQGPGSSGNTQSTSLTGQGSTVQQNYFNGFNQFLLKLRLLFTGQ